METITLCQRIRVSTDAPHLSSDDEDALVAAVTDAYWSSFKPTPNRAKSAAASIAVRQKRSAEAAAATQTAKVARIDGSANNELPGDSSDTLTGRVEFSNATYRAKIIQPTGVTHDLVGKLLAKLVVLTDDAGVRTEAWEVGRVRSVKDVTVALPQGGATTSAFLFVWQMLNRGGIATGDVIPDMSLDVTACGPTREWAMVEPKPVTGRGRGRARGRRRGRPRGSN